MKKVIYYNCIYFRKSLSKHLKNTHKGKFKGKAKFRACGRCGFLGLDDCGCDPEMQLRLPDDQLLEQMVLKLSKNVKLGKEDR